MSAAATIPLSRSEQKRMEIVRTSHLRQILRVPDTARVPNKIVRATCKRPSVESLLHLDRLRRWSAACRDQPHGFFRSTLFGLVADENPAKRPSRSITYRASVQQSVDLFSEKIHLADWSLEPDLLLGAQMVRGLAKFTNPLSAAELYGCLLYTSPSPRDKRQSRMPSSA